MDDGWEKVVSAEFDGLDAGLMELEELEVPTGAHYHRARVREMKRCAVAACGKEFWPVRSGWAGCQTYCSKRCRNRAQHGKVTRKGRVHLPIREMREEK